MTAVAGPVGVLGGTFDPVHYGHLRTAVELREALALSELRLLPCRVPPHRGRPSASPEQRLAMLELALASEPGLTIDRSELERAGPSYMVDTLQGLRAELGAARPLCLVLGVDAYNGIGSWHRWQALPELAHLVVVTRPGAELAPGDAVAACYPAPRAASAQRLAASAAGGVWLQPVTQMAISATDLRARLARRRSIRFLTPDAVVEYLRAQRLYTDIP